MKPSIPKGTRDFSPEEILKRDLIFDTVRGIFRLYGYQPVETPAIENLSTLLGKYGEEGDRLIFRILNSGDFLSGIDRNDLLQGGSSGLSSLICEKGLRYDLTVPFARYVVQHRDEIVFPFRRYQIQPVWRADRPQKGRYREFFQCDADVIGSDSLLNEFELIRIIDDVFSRLNVNVIIRINNRKVLSGIAEFIGESAKITDITIAIDKIDKIGPEEVNKELAGRGIPADAIRRLRPILELSGGTQAKLASLRKILCGSETGLRGIEELTTLFAYISGSSMINDTDFDLTLARGLNYYTGTIMEVRAKDVSIGSICGGGRYDNLTGVFGMEGVSGVGISFGADRIYDVMSQLGLFGRTEAGVAKVLILNFGENEIPFALKVRQDLIRAGISAELYPDCSKLKRQMSYAGSRKIPFVILAGEEEIKAGRVILKNMTTGDQGSFSPDELILNLKVALNS